jgi:hypothetical protein
MKIFFFLYTLLQCFGGLGQLFLSFILNIFKLLRLNFGPEMRMQIRLKLKSVVFSFSVNNLVALFILREGINLAHRVIAQPIIISANIIFRCDFLTLQILLLYHSHFNHHFLKWWPINMINILSSFEILFLFNCITLGAEGLYDT